MAAGFAAAAPDRDPCIPPGAKTVRIHGGPLVLSAAVVGNGPRGVVLSNQSDNSPCAWLPLAKRLVRSGFRVALYYYSGQGAYADTLAVAAKLRRLGAKEIALIGASEGAKSSIAAAAKTRASAVVSLSAERSLDGYGDLLPAARRLRAPIVYLYSKGDPLAELNTPQLYAATREHDKQLVAFSGYDHGTDLLKHPTVPPLIERFLRSRLSPPRTSSVATAPVPGLATRCGGHPGGATFWFKSADGARLDGAVLGSGRTGVVLSTGFPGELCGWLPEALVLRSRGLRVFLFDLRGMGESPLPQKARAQLDYVQDVVGAARELRSRGVTRVYLMGSSMGATASIVGAARIRPTVAGVVSLSGPADLSGVLGGGLNALSAARRLGLPVLYLAAKDDPPVPPADVARVRAALHARGSRVVVFPGLYHGDDLVSRAPYRAGLRRSSRASCAASRDRRCVRSRRPTVLHPPAAPSARRR